MFRLDLIGCYRDALYLPHTVSRKTAPQDSAEALKGNQHILTIYGKLRHQPITRQSEIPLTKYLRPDHEPNCSLWPKFAGDGSPRSLARSLVIPSQTSDALRTFGPACRVRIPRQRDLLDRRWHSVWREERHAADLESCAARMGVCRSSCIRKCTR